MIKTLRYIIFSFVLILQFSCFEILEEVNLNSDGSGLFKYTINFSRSKTYIKALLSEDTSNGYQIPTEDVIKREIYNSVAVCKATQGISNTFIDINLEDYICVFKCDFSSINHLNQMITNVRVHRKDKTQPMNSFYNYTNHQFNRLNDKVFSDVYHNMSDNEKKILNDADYTCIYRFDKEITSYSNSNAKLSTNKTALLLKVKILEVIHQSKTLKNNIKLKL